MTRVAMTAAMAGALAFLLVGCGGGEEESAPEEFAGVPLELQDPGPVHVHGLGYDPRRKILYLATHTGMFELKTEPRRPRGSGTVTRTRWGSRS